MVTLNRSVLSFRQRFSKRTFDLCLSAIGLICGGWLILLAYILASVDTRSNGMFCQKRVGRNGRLFTVFKIKTMTAVENVNTTVTQSGDPRITKLGAIFRKTKIDELPQLWNVLCGDMSFVGPRPDVPGFADKLEGEAQKILTVRPGITGPATLKYRDEESLLAKQSDPEYYNEHVIYPDKVRLNLEYVKYWGFGKDLVYIKQTVLG